MMKHWSASQVSSFRLCARKWYFKNVMHLPEPESRALRDGKVFAEECEVYMRTGSTGGLSATTRPVAALVAEERFPKPKHINTLVEYPIGEDTRPLTAPGEHATILDVDGTPGVGFMDVCHLKEDRPVVWDFKSTKSKRYVKTQDELRVDVQMTLYAKATTVLHQRRYGTLPQLVGVGHVALLKAPESPEAVVVGPAWMTLEDIDAQWEGIKTSVRSMKEVAQIQTPDRVTPTWTACKAFGGCPHADKCSAMRSMTDTSTTEGTTMTLLEKLKAQQQSLSAAPAAPAAPAARVVPQAASTTNDLAAKLRAKLAQPGQINPPDAAAAGDAGIANAVRVAPQALVVPSTPVEAPPSNTRRQPRNGTPRLIQLGWTMDEIETMDVERKHEILDNNLTPAAANPVAGIDLNSNEALEMGMALGYSEHELNTMSDEVLLDILSNQRKAPSAEPAPVVVVAPVVVAPAPVVKPVPAPVVKPAPAPAPVVEEQVEQAEREARGPLMLFIDCRPAKGFDDAVELSEYCAPLMQMVCEKKKVEHYSLPAYNEGDKLVAALLMMNPPAGLILVDSTLPFSRYALEVLLPIAKLVVRGAK
jgi:hypothetical protein